MPYKDTPGGLTAKEKKKAWARNRYASNIEEEREKGRIKAAAWRTANREKYQVGRKQYALQHQKHLLEQAAKRYADNPEPRRSRVRHYYADHSEKVKDYQQRYRKEHPDRINDLSQVRRARKRSAPVVERIYRQVVFDRDGGICHICHGATDPLDWHIDHIIPLSRGGEHSYRNVAVSHPRCNRVKHNSMPAPAP